MSLDLHENIADDLQAKESDSAKRSSQTLSLISKRIGQAILSLAIGTEGVAQAKSSVDNRPVSMHSIHTDDELSVFKEAIDLSEDFAEEETQLLALNPGDELITDPDAPEWQRIGESLYHMSAEIPLLARKIGELELTLPKYEERKAPYVEQLNGWIKNLAEYRAALKTAEKELTYASKKNKPKIQDRINALNRAITNYEKDIIGLNAAIQNIDAEKNKVYEQMAAIEQQITEQQLKIAEGADLFVLHSIKDGRSLNTARAEVQQIIASAYKLSYESLPHIKVQLDMNDMSITSNACPISLLDANAFRPQNSTPVVSRGGGLVKIYGNVRNDGDRAGYVTLEVYGRSAYHPEMPMQQSIKIWLNPGQVQRFVTTVNLPPSDEKTRAYAQFLAKTPGEETVSLICNTAKPKSMDSSSYEQGGVGAMKHNAKVIMESSGGIGSIEERLARYVQSDPESAAIIASQIKSETSGTDAEFNEAFMPAYIASLPKDQQVAQNVKNEMATEVLSELDADGSVVLMAMLEDGKSWDVAVADYKKLQEEHTHPLDTILDQCIEPMDLKVGTDIPEMVTFELIQDSMVNFWSDHILYGNSTYNISLTITGTDLPTAGYTSEKSTIGRAESVSLRLKKGKYKLTVRNKDATPMRQSDGGFDQPIKLGINIKPFRSQNIEGMISIDRSSFSMPVSIRVAEFKPNNKRETDFNRISQIDVNNHIWLVIHGMNSSEKGGIESVARELFLNGQQVVTVDWSIPANVVDTTNAPWTKAVGEWTTSQLIGLGFNPDKINIVGHSHGTYIAFAAANKAIQLRNTRINSIIALDPAGNIPLISGFNDNIINFADVSGNSIAIEGSWAAGQDSLARTADVAYKVISEDINPVWFVTEHSLPVSTFANLLKVNRSINNVVPENLQIAQIMTSNLNQSLLLKQDAIGNNYEGHINVRTQDSIDQYGVKYIEAIPDSIEAFLEDGRWQIWNILNVEETPQNP